MTREEAMYFGEIWLELQKDLKGSNTYEFFKIATQALKQKPCEDAVSRQYLVEKAVSWDKHFADGIRYVALTDILNAPSVTPAEKVGHWIDDIDSYGTSCSKCGK